VLNTQLEKQAKAGRLYVAGDDVSIADFAILDWSNGYANYAIEEREFPAFVEWRARMRARPGTAKALDIKLDVPQVDISKDATAQKVLFGQR
jgi:glutathione S-transferase